MFKREYQGGSHVMVLSAQGRDTLAHCKIMGSVSHRYDKGIRGYIHVLEGDSITTKIQLPSNDKTSLALVQSCLVLQVIVEKDARFIVELYVQVNKGGRRRIFFSSSMREPSISPLIARLPLITMVTGEWCNICFDLSSLVTELFPGHTHKSLDSLVVGGACQLRRAFTMKERPRDSYHGDDDLITAGDIPTACQLMINNKPIITKVISSVTNDNQQPMSSVAMTTSHQSSCQPLTHVAFGKKVVIPAHVLARQETKSRGASNVRKKVQSSGMKATHRQGSAPSSVGRVGVSDVMQSGVEGVGLDGRGQNYISHKKKKERRDNISGGDQNKSLEKDELLALSDKQCDDTVQDLIPGGMESRQNTSTPNPTKVDLEQKRIDDDDNNPSYLEYTSEEEEEEEVCDDGDIMLKDDDAATDQMFSYFSPPKTAVITHTPSDGSSRDIRGVDLNHDFLLQTTSTVNNEQGSPRSHGDKSDDEERITHDVSGMSYDVIDKAMPREKEVVDGVVSETMDTGISRIEADMNETRLSDDYDWRLYTSCETHPQSPPSPLAHHPHTLTGHHDNNTDPDTSTLSESIVTEKTATHSLLDSLDTRNMGGALSPIMSDPSVNQFDPLLNQSVQSEDELELMYDPQLKCFFDPKTHKYYELIQ